MNNIKELRQELIDIFEQLKSKKIKAKEAKELVNTAGKIISTVKLQIDYAKLNKATLNVDFINDGEDIKEEPKEEE